MSLESPASILYDSNGIETTVTAGVAMPISTSGYIGAGVDSSNIVRYWRAASTGEMFITGAVTANVSINAVAQGNSGSIGQSWYMSITDGTKVLGTGSSAPLWITGAVTVANLGNITMSVSVSNTPTVNQGNSGSIAQSWPVVITNGTQVLGTGSSAPLFVTGSVGVVGVVTSSAERSATANRTDVARNAASTTILASNTSRNGATVFNDTNANLFIRFGAAAASTTDFTVKLSAGSYYEVPFNFTGALTGIWASAGTGAARVTEILV